MNNKLFGVSLGTALLALVALVMVPTAAVAQTRDISFASTTGYGQSASTIMINNIQVSFTTTNPFDPTHPTIQTARYNVPFAFDQTTLHLVPTLGGAQDDSDTSSLCAGLTVTVSSAATGSPLSGAVITVGSASAATNTSGVATFSGLRSGSAVLISATAANYTATSRTTDLSCTIGNSVGLSLSPSSGTGALTANQVRIVLTWGANPSDLDSHLTGPSSASSGSLTDTTNRFHVYYAARTAETTLGVLDVDDTSSFGPETVTISPPSGRTTLRAGLYRYSIHHYAGSSNIPGSGASVTLYLGGRQQEFRPPANSSAIVKAVWTVFELAVDAAGGVTVYPVGTYSTESSASAVRSTTTGYGDIERGIDFARLLPK